MESTGRRAPDVLQKLRTWAPPGAWAGLIYLLSATPDLTFSDDGGVDFVVRKLGHLAVFGILMILTLRAVELNADLRRPWIVAMALTVLYAITDELHQGAVAGRHPSPVDVAIDTAGVALALVAVALARSAAARGLLQRGDRRER